MKIDRPELPKKTPNASVLKFHCLQSWMKTGEEICIEKEATIIELSNLVFICTSVRTSSSQESLTSYLCFIQTPHLLGIAYKTAISSEKWLTEEDIIT